MATNTHTRSRSQSAGPSYVHIEDEVVFPLPVTDASTNHGPPPRVTDSTEEPVMVDQNQEHAWFWPDISTPPVQAAQVRVQAPPTPGPSRRTHVNDQARREHQAVYERQSRTRPEPPRHTPAVVPDDELYGFEILEEPPRRRRQTGGRTEPVPRERAPRRAGQYAAHQRRQDGGYSSNSSGDDVRRTFPRPSQPDYSSESDDDVPRRPHRGRRTSRRRVPPSRLITDLPLPGSKRAPTRFTGRFDNVSSWLELYEDMCAKYGVTDPDQMCRGLTRYCTRKVREVIEAIPAYQNRDWPRLYQEIEHLYDADFYDEQYQVSDLQEFVDKMVTRKMGKLSSYKKYSREFIRRAGRMKNNGTISEYDYLRFFWMGINPNLRKDVRDHLVLTYPNHNKKRPWSIEQINEMVGVLLRRGAFDNILQDDLDDDSEVPASEEESSASGSDDEKESDKSKKKKKSKVVERTRKTPSARVATVRADSLAAATEKLDRRNRREVEDLVAEMAPLPRTDPSYAVLYYKAATRDETIKQFWPRPITDADDVPGAAKGKTAKGFLAQSYAATANAEQPRDAPPHQQRTTWQQRSSNTDPDCYGCGDPGHRLQQCPEVNDLLQRKIIQYQNGRLAHANGAPIRRRVGEKIAQAARREHAAHNSGSTAEKVSAAVSNYVGLVASWESSEDADSGSEDEAEGGFVGMAAIQDASDSDDLEDEISAMVFEATEATTTKKKKYAPGASGHRTRSSTGTATRKPAKDLEEFEMAARKKSGRTTSRIPGETRAHPRSTGNKGKARDGSGEQKTTRFANVEVQQVPSAEDVLMVDPENDENFLDDMEAIDELSDSFDPMPVTGESHTEKVDEGAQTQRAAQRAAEIRRERAREVEDGGEPEPKPKSRPRVSAISATADCDSAYDAFLDKTLNISLRDLIVLSDYVQNRLVKDCKKKSGDVAKSIPKVLATKLLARGFASMGRSPARGELLEFEVVVNRREKISLEVAHGETVDLHGLVQDVPLALGGAIHTQASFYRMDHPVNYQLLLGRPWQRSNMVNIEERQNGTYLVFRDGQDRITYDILVTPVDRDTVYGRDGKMKVDGAAQSNLVRVARHNPRNLDEEACDSPNGSANDSSAESSPVNSDSNILDDDLAYGKRTYRIKARPGEQWKPIIHSSSSRRRPPTLLQPSPPSLALPVSAPTFDLHRLESADRAPTRPPRQASPRPSRFPPRTRSRWTTAPFSFSSLPTYSFSTMLSVADWLLGSRRAFDNDPTDHEAVRSGDHVNAARSTDILARCSDSRVDPPRGLTAIYNLAMSVFSPRGFQLSGGTFCDPATGETKSIAEYALINPVFGYEDDSTDIESGTVWTAYAGSRLNIDAPDRARTVVHNRAILYVQCIGSGVPATVERTPGTQLSILGPDDVLPRVGEPLPSFFPHFVQHNPSIETAPTDRSFENIIALLQHALARDPGTSSNILFVGLRHSFSAEPSRVINGLEALDIMIPAGSVIHQRGEWTAAMPHDGCYARLIRTSELAPTVRHYLLSPFPAPNGASLQVPDYLVQNLRRGELATPRLDLELTSRPVPAARRNDYYYNRVMNSEYSMWGVASPYDETQIAPRYESYEPQPRAQFPDRLPNYSTQKIIEGYTPLKKDTAALNPSGGSVEDPGMLWLLTDPISVRRLILPPEMMVESEPCTPKLFEQPLSRDLRSRVGASTDWDTVPLSHPHNPLKLGPFPRVLQQWLDDEDLGLNISLRVMLLVISDRYALWPSKRTFQWVANDAVNPDGIIALVYQANRLYDLHLRNLPEYYNDDTYRLIKSQITSIALRAGVALIYYDKDLTLELMDKITAAVPDFAHDLHGYIDHVNSMSPLYQSSAERSRIASAPTNSVFALDAFTADHEMPRPSQWSSSSSDDGGSVYSPESASSGDESLRLIMPEAEGEGDEDMADESRTGTVEVNNALPSPPPPTLTSSQSFELVEMAPVTPAPAQFARDREVGDWLDDIFRQVTEQLQAELAADPARARSASPSPSTSLGDDRAKLSPVASYLPTPSSTPPPPPNAERSSSRETEHGQSFRAQDSATEHAEHATVPVPQRSEPTDATSQGAATVGTEDAELEEVDPSTPSTPAEEPDLVYEADPAINRYLCDAIGSCTNEEFRRELGARIGSVQVRLYEQREREREGMEIQGPPHSASAGAPAADTVPSIATRTTDAGPYRPNCGQPYALQRLDDPNNFITGGVGLDYLPDELVSAVADRRDSINAVDLIIVLRDEIGHIELKGWTRLERFTAHFLHRLDHSLFQSATLADDLRAIQREYVYYVGDPDELFLDTLAALRTRVRHTREWSMDCPPNPAMRDPPRVRPTAPAPSTTREVGIKLSPPPPVAASSTPSSLPSLETIDDTSETEEWTTDDSDSDMDLSEEDEEPVTPPPTKAEPVPQRESVKIVSPTPRLTSPLSRFRLNPHAAVFVPQVSPVRVYTVRVRSPVEREVIEISSDSSSDKPYVSPSSKWRPFPNEPTTSTDPSPESTSPAPSVAVGALPPREEREPLFISLRKVNLDGSSTPSSASSRSSEQALEEGEIEEGKEIQRPSQGGRNGSSPDRAATRYNLRPYPARGSAPGL
ncbi:unnamed protein product [Peniophora sp. CBMAI 1063]|nr:unnamed protein product [Peniophora sp. CBMAI 1063]